MADKTFLTTVLLSTLLLAEFVSAQGKEFAYVATQLKGNPSTQVLDVDFSSGKFTVIGRFKHDALVPLAITVDPNTRDLILAVDLGKASRLLRLVIRGGRVQTESILTDVTGKVHSMIINHKGAIYATVLGVGLYQIERTGSSKRLLLSLPQLTGISTMPVFSKSIAVLIEKGNTQRKLAPRLRVIDLETGKTVQGPFSYPNIKNPNVMSVGALKTALDRIFLADDKGQIYFSHDVRTSSLLTVKPQMPAGGVRRVLHSRIRDGIVLGGAADPRIKYVQSLNREQKWTFVTGRLPGDPVDLAIKPPERSQEQIFGDGCAPGRGSPLSLRFTSPPHLGNPKFGFSFTGSLGNSSVLMLLGLDSQSFLQTRLPLTMPGGCELLASVSVILSVRSNGRGEGSTLLPMPNNKSLSGQILFGQWVELRKAGFASSNAGSVQIFPFR